MKYKTILFDLDDTIFDHQYARRCGLKTLLEHYDIPDIPLIEFEKIHQHYLDSTFKKVLEKKISLEESRKERMVLLFNHFGIKLEKNEAKEADTLYRSKYNDNRQSIPGVVELIEELKKRIKIGIITNGLYNEQIEKISICKIEKYIDYMIVSENIGFKKPELDYFIKALEIIHNEKNECVVVGDSWEIDISGAYNAGIKSIWLNRYNDECPDPSITTEINSYENREEILSLLI